MRLLRLYLARLLLAIERLRVRVRQRSANQIWRSRRPRHGSVPQTT